MRQSAVRGILKRKKKSDVWLQKFRTFIQGLLLHFKNIKSFWRVGRKPFWWEGFLGGNLCWELQVLSFCEEIRGGLCLNLLAFKSWSGHFESLTCVAWSLRNDELPQKIGRAGEKLVSCVGGGGVKASNCFVWKITSCPPVVGHKGARDPGPAFPRLF